jgi:hypothetical protein
MLALFIYWGFTPLAALFAAALCLATSAAITIATCSDVGAKGERTGLLYTMVAINGCVAFLAVILLQPFFDDTVSTSLLVNLGGSLGSILGSVILGGACAGLVLLGAEKLERQPEHQHLLILGSIVLGVGTALYLEVSVLLPMLIFGFLVRTIDGERKVIAIRIASDARVFLVITFVLAGAALDIAHLAEYCMTRRPLRIGLSARIYHPQPGATGLQSKSLQYLEQSVAHWVMSREVMVFMIPSVSGDGVVHRSSIRLSDYPQYLDGLVCRAAPTSARNPTARSPCIRTGPATACATPTRWNCCTNSWKPASRCSASAAARS